MKNFNLSNSNFANPNFVKKIHDFFELFYETSATSIKKGPSLFFCRNDGLIIYYKNKLNKKIDENAIGALLGGVWQASVALTGFMPETLESEKDSYFRLSFDTSSRGIYVLPFTFNNEDYYLGMIYFDEVNPAVVKARLRELIKKLEIYINEEFCNKELNNKELNNKALNKTENLKNSNLLFSNITDEEMDNLFSFARE